MASEISKKIVQQRYRSYLNKDFNNFRSDLLQYAGTYFSENIRDFTNPSMGGLLLDFAAYVGDVLSYYMDHQFTELDPELAVENSNIERHIKMAGVKTAGAAPASVDVDFYIRADSEEVDGEYIPKASILPQILEGTKVTSSSGIIFELTADIDFAEKNRDGTFVAHYVTGDQDSSGNPSNFIMRMSGLCVSGKTITESFSIPNSFIPFRTITLSNDNVSEIISIIDSEGERYYEVDSLAQDVVYKRVLNADDDSDLVSENIELIPAPRRFITSTSRATGLTTIRFGSGQADTLDDDIIPDPSEIALPLYGKKTFSRFSIDPNSLLRTRTLGISPVNTTLSIRYRAGGGLSHNVDAETIRSISTLKTYFSDGISSSTQQQIRSSTSVRNSLAAAGGENRPTLDELRAIALAFRNAQSRIVTKEDLVARIYTMPSNFGRVYRVGIRSNPDNPLASNVYIISRNLAGELITSPDNLKLNLRTYLNQFRLVSDAIEILDAEVVNLGVEYNVVVDSYSNKTTVLQNINAALKKFLSISNFQIDQPIIISDLSNIINNVQGVISLSEIGITNLTGVVEEREYTGSVFNINSNTDRGIVIPPPGGMFEVKFPDSDIIGNAV